MRINGKSRITGKYGAFDRNMNRKKEQIQERQESGKGFLCRRSQADSVARLERKVFASSVIAVCAAPSHVGFVKTPELKRHCFYKKSSGYFFFFPASGYRNYSDGKLYNSGTNGYGWTSTPYNSSNAWNLNFNSGDAYVNNNNRGNGFPVRCVQASAPVFVFAKDTFVFFPASGLRGSSDGKLGWSGSWGGCWTSTSFGSGSAWLLSVAPGSAYVGTDNSGLGLPVRCVQASAAVFAFTKDTFCFFPASGYRNYIDGKLAGLGSSGYGWSSTPVDSSTAYSLLLYSGAASMYNYVRNDGFTVRCVQASAAVFVFIKETFVFFPASGRRDSGNGSLGYSSRYGYGWTSTPNGTSRAYRLLFFSGDAYVDSNLNYPTYGFPVRCVQASAAVWAVRKKDLKQIRYRRESGKGILCRRGQADSVTRLGRKLFANENRFVCAALSYSITLIKIPVFDYLYFYKYSSGYFFFFPAAGIRNYSDGSLRISGGEGDGWTSTPFNSDNAYRFILNSGNAGMGYANRDYGFPVRCVQASAAVFTFTNDTFAFFPASGIRHYSDGSVRYSGTEGHGWTSTPFDSDNAYRFILKPGYANMGSDASRTYGLPVRCVQASALVFVSSLQIKWQIRYRRESGKASLCRRGQADSVTRLGRKLSVNETVSVCAVPSYSIRFIKIPVFECLYFCKHSSGYFFFFPASGSRNSNDGKVYGSGTAGYGWASTPNGSTAWLLDFWSTNVRMYYYLRGNGLPVRCVQASATVFAFTNDTFVFFPAAGYRHYDAGNLNNSGTQALVWSSVPSGESAYRLYSSPTGAFVTNVQRTYGFTVRCVQASATVWAVKKENIKQIRYRRESGKGILYRRGQADSVTRLGRKLFASENYFVSTAPSYLIRLIKIPVFKCLYFYKHSSGYFLFFPASGYRDYKSGSLGDSGSNGYGWTSVVSGDNACYLYFSFGAAYIGIYYRDYGRPVRCVQASASVFVFIRKNIEEALFFFPASGNREYNDGSLVYVGMWGHGWSSSPSDGTNAWFFRFSSGVVHVYSGPRTHGLSVRCVQASAAVFAFSNYLKRRKKAA